MVDILKQKVSERISSNLRMIEKLKDYSKMKLEENDFHGCVDGNMDCRDLHSEIVAYTQVLKWLEEFKKE